MPTQLTSPTNVTTTNPTATAITVTWDDNANTAGTVGSYAVSFISRDALLPVTLPSGTTTTTANGTTKTLTLSGLGTPSGTLLASNYIAQVTAKAPSGSTTYSDSAAGTQVYWSAAGSLIVQIGSQTFTLTQASFNSTIYRLPVSNASPLTITLPDIISFANEIGGMTVPTTWPNGATISNTAALNLYKLAMDKTRMLFALEVAFVLDWEVIPGLTINQVGMSVLRTNGVNTL